MPSSSERQNIFDFDWNKNCNCQGYYVMETLDKDICFFCFKKIQTQHIIITSHIKVKTITDIVFSYIFK